MEGPWIKNGELESQRVERLFQQVRRQDVSCRYHEQETGVFVGACPISAPGAPCLCKNVVSFGTGVDTMWGETLRIYYCLEDKQKNKQTTHELEQPNNMFSGPFLDQSRTLAKPGATPLKLSKLMGTFSVNQNTLQIHYIEYNDFRAIPGPRQSQTIKLAKQNETFDQKVLHSHAVIVWIRRILLAKACGAFICKN